MNYNHPQDVSQLEKSRDFWDSMRKSDLFDVAHSTVFTLLSSGFSGYSVSEIANGNRYAGTLMLIGGISTTAFGLYMLSEGASDYYESNTQLNEANQAIAKHLNQSVSQ